MCLLNELDYVDDVYDEINKLHGLKLPSKISTPFFRDILNYLRSKGFKLDMYHLVCSAVLEGSLDTLTWLWETEELKEKIPMDELIETYLESRGENKKNIFSCVKFCIDKGVDVDVSHIMDTILEYEDLELVKYLHYNGVDMSDGLYHMPGSEIFYFLLNMGYVIDNRRLTGQTEEEYEENGKLFDS